MSPVPDKNPKLLAIALSIAALTAPLNLEQKATRK